LQLKYFKEDGTIGFRKGTGILIGDEIVLTAGHNVFK
jgi:V8-like Glu-specific endopeptidase